MISLQYLNPISKSFSIISLNCPITITITYINKDKKCIIYTVHCTVLPRVQRKTGLLWSNQPSFFKPVILLYSIQPLDAWR